MACSGAGLCAIVQYDARSAKWLELSRMMWRSTGRCGVRDDSGWFSMVRIELCH